MLELPHAMVGAAIAAKVNNPALGLPLALASHFVLDMAPHWNPHLNTELKKAGKISKETLSIVLGDSTFALLGGAAIASTAMPDINRAIIILLGGFLGVLPDFVEFPYYFMNLRHKFYSQYYIPFKKSIQGDIPMVPGLITQVIVLLATVWWVFF